MTDMNDNENNQTTDESEYDDDSDQDMYFDDLEESNYDTINNHDDIPCLEMVREKDMECFIIMMVLNIGEIG